MSFPFEFSRKSGDYDLYSPVINLIGNTAVVAVGGVSLVAISYLALKTLGFGKITLTSISAIPVAIGIGSAATALTLGFISVALVADLGNRFINR